MKAKNISVRYYYDTTYNKNKIELERYLHPNGVVTLHSTNEKPVDAIGIWMGDDIDQVSHLTFDKYYNLLYKKILNILGLSNEGINTSLFQPEPYLEEIYQKLDNKFKDLDVLIINANSNSLRMFIDHNYFNTLSDNLSKKFKIATTVAVNDTIPSTLRDGLTIQDIGAISTHAKYIVSVYTGPLTACFTEATKKSVKKWFIFVNNPTTFEEINTLLISNFSDISQVENEIQ